MDIKPILEQKYPENSHGGQCVYFLHRLVEFPPTGNYLNQKIATVEKYGIPARNLHGDFRVGDIVITNESRTYGHGAIVNAIKGNNLRLTESNYYNDEKVHHTRLLRMSAPSIIGVIRGKSLIKYENMQLINDSGTVYIYTGVKDNRVIGIADLESLGAFGDEPQKPMSVKGIPYYQDIVKGDL